MLLRSPVVTFAQKLHRRCYQGPATQFVAHQVPDAAEKPRPQDLYSLTVSPDWLVAFFRLLYHYLNKQLFCFDFVGRILLPSSVAVCPNIIGWSLSLRLVLVDLAKLASQ